MKVSNKKWDEVPEGIALSLVMLFADVQRWNLFAKVRFAEMRAAGIFDEMVIVINRDDEEMINLVVAGVTSQLRDFPIYVLFRSKNNIPAARNAGIKVARGKSVLIWDDDDGCDPQALASAYRDVFVPGKFQLLELPLDNGDGSPMHPQEPDIMPQVKYPGCEDILVVGMVHTPFFASRKMLLETPIPEYVALRGDWLHWSAELWRSEIPILCLKGRKVATEWTRPRDSGATASCAVTPESCFHSLLSLVYLFWRYEIPADSVQAEIIRRRYFLKYCPAKDLDVTWQIIMQMGQALKVGCGITSITRLNECVTHDLLRQAFAQVEGHITSRHVSLESTPHKIDVGPFEIFNPDYRSELQRLVATSVVSESILV